MARRASVVDPLLACIINGNVEDVKQMFRDSHVQGYHSPQHRHEALCSAVRNDTMSGADRSDIVRLLACNIDGFDPHFEAGIAHKNIVQVALDEGRYELLPMLMRESVLEGSSVLGLLHSFKLKTSEALEAKAALHLLNDDSSLAVCLDPLDLVPVSDISDDDRERDQSGRHFHYLKWLLEEVHVNAAVLYRKTHSKVVAVSRNCAFDAASGAELLRDMFPVSEDFQTHGLTINGRHYAFMGSLSHLFPPADGNLLSWAHFSATSGHHEELVMGCSRDLIVAAQFGNDINSLNPDFQEEAEEEDAAPQRVQSHNMPGHRYSAGDDFEYACRGLQTLLQTWVDVNM